ncbi:MAG: acetyl-CoA hydrolase/transferase C-terminal domain-containing protein [Pseudomonadota bacterium]|nr:acetyl-CoA hydrolase/transferase C-terminal domain-containing protein [Pseudomonadota bacterium]
MSSSTRRDACATFPDRAGSGRTKDEIDEGMTADPRRYETARACVDATIERVGRRVVLGLPLALGKANHIANAFYARACEDPGLDLTIYTALTLEVPRAPNALAARLLDPVAARLYAGYPELDYARDRRAGRLPDNVTVREFFLPPGTLLDNASAQQNYVSANYTHAAREILEAGVNVIAQMVAPEPGGDRLSLSCNTDLSLDMVPAMRAQAQACGKDAVVLGEINADLPFMGHAAEVPADWFDGLYDAGRYTLFPVPSPAVSPVDHAIGLRAASLVRDGGTLQIGIGALSDAVSWAIRMRHADNDGFRALLAALPGSAAHGVAERIGGLGPLEKGLYACSEMLTEGLLDLLESGLVRRGVSDDPDIEAAIARGERPAPGPGEAVCLHGGFYLGSSAFYARLRSLDDRLRDAIGMTTVSHINDLYGEETLARLQRRDARFINTAMQVNGRGAAISDTLEDGRVVSGVGGQYNFAAMAQELDDGRSVILLRSTRTSGGTVRSNIVWSGGEVTVPRHLRDIVVTEYGVADLRGATDREVAIALAGISDARFQDGFLEAAKSAGKVEADYRLPDTARHNTPERLRAALTAAGGDGRLPAYPYGSALSAEEQALAAALEHLRSRAATLTGRLDLLFRSLRRPAVPGWARRHIERMGMDTVSRLTERVERRLLVQALWETRPRAQAGEIDSETRTSSG